MDQTVSLLGKHFPGVTYRKSKQFYWSPKTNEVFYTTLTDPQTGVWSLLHETAHAALGHTMYRADFELVLLEIAAWEKAKDLARELLSMEIDEDHIQDCLDTYRDWLCARSTCPGCGNLALQQSDFRHYQCFNCHARWKVSPSRFCRAYRSTRHADKPTALPHFLLEP